MQPGQELDRRVCEIVGIKPTKESTYTYTYGWWTSDTYPPVSTEFGPWTEKMLEWLTGKIIFWSVMLSLGNYHICTDEESITLGIGDTFIHALCLAIVAVGEEAKP